MATRRMIHQSISVSEQVNELSDFGALLFTWMIAHADDFGRMPGSEKKVKAIVVPMRDVSLEEIQTELNRMHELNLICRYLVNGEWFIQFQTWDRHQSGLHKRTQSRFPDPPLHSVEFREVPGNSLPREQNRREENRTEGNGTEEKRTAFPFCSDEVAATSVKDDMNLSSSLELKYRNALRVYESSGFGPLDSTVQQTIDSMCDDFTENWFTQAVEEAVLQNKRRLAYVRSILQNWRAEGGVRRSGGVEVELSVHRKGNPSTRRTDDNPKKSITGGQIGWIAPRESS